jgi:hypothetical protein
VSLDALLSKLEAVRSTGPGTWLARCPSHPDKRPSLSICETADGRVLLHDFAGCSVEEILGTLGMTFDDLFLGRAIGQRRRRERPPFPASDVLVALSTETLIVAVLASQMADGHEITDEDHARLILAASRLLAAVDLQGLDPEGERIRRNLVKSRGAAMDFDRPRAPALQLVRKRDAIAA